MSENIKMFLIYLIVINLVGFFAMAIDKMKAQRKMWRTPERVLLGFAILGGSAGVWLGMEIFRHKTQHWNFKLGVPVIFILETIGLLYLFLK